MLGKHPPSHCATSPMLCTKKLTLNWPLGRIVMVRLCFMRPPGVIVSHVQQCSVTPGSTAWLPFHSSLDPCAAMCHMLLQARAALIVGHGKSKGTNTAHRWAWVFFVTRSVHLG